MERWRNGFTLIELMIVVAIIALIVTVAYPSYVEHVTRSKRSEAQAALMKAIQLQERFYTVNGEYATNAQLPGLFGLAAGPVYSGQNAGDITTSWYVITVEETCGARTLCVNLVATPKAGYSDPECDVLSMNTTGARAETGTRDVAYCFK